MIKSWTQWLFVCLAIFGVSYVVASAAPPEPVRQFLEMEGQRNLLANPGFENGKGTWNLVSPASTFTILNNSTVVGLGERSFAFDSQGVGEGLESDLFVIPGALASKACVAKIGYNWSTGTAGQMYLEVYNHANSKLASTVLMPQTGWGQRTVNFTCPAEGSLKMRLNTAIDKGNPPALHLDSMWLGSDYSTINSVTSNVYYAGAHQGGASACQMVWSTTSLAASAADTDCTLATDNNLNFGSVALEGGGSPTAGLVITPANTGNYLVCVSMTMDGTVSQVHDFQLLDVTDSRTITRGAGAIDAGGSQYSLTMCGVDTFSNLSARTIRLNGAVSSGTVTAVQRTVSSIYAPTLYWTIAKLN